MFQPADAVGYPIGQLAQTIGFQSTGIDWCLVRPRDLKGKREPHKRAV